MFQTLRRGLRKAIAPPDIAIDLGTALTRVISADGSVCEEPTRTSAWRRTLFHSTAVCPLRRGFVQDAAAASEILEPMVRSATSGWTLKPRALACVPTSAGTAERDMVMQVARSAGIRCVAITPEPLAAAIGSGVDLASPWAQILVDIGDGVTDLAVIRGGQPVHTATLDLACGDLRERVARRISASSEVLLEDGEAERLLRLACAVPGDGDDRVWLAEGRDPYTGLETALCVSSGDILEAIDPLVGEIALFVREVVRGLPSAIAVEVIESGMWITGGGAALPRLAQRLERTTRLDVHSPADPLRAVITGAGRMLTIADSTLLWEP